VSDLVARSPDVAATVDEFVETLEMLEILVLLSRDASRAWTAAELAAALSISDRSAQGALAHLVATGLLGAAGAPTAYVLAADDQRRSRALATILGALASNRTELVNHIALGANARRQAFADLHRRRSETT
jgi:hypothetical protein